MAVIKHITGLEVSVTVGGEIVKEYEHTSNDEGLYQEGIIPRPSPAEELVQSMTDAEARILAQAYIESQEIPNIGIKRERKPDGIPLSDESFQARYKTRRLESGQFEVNLTDELDETD
ncbi:hypothetical protein B0T14DRAFT_559205 [Immersiella caudata]|uniref:Uncharacterized protein n=1 Tax=Immersiella caudata TaxID=314043 RepID=A0AA39XCY9_9PEZI|nr:hypothetical protein B0T14DRAFT_559205 [Immersiella caudata]